MAMDDKRPIVFPDEEPIKLKIPPKSCELCGKPFIPTGGNAKYCPSCREMSKKKRDRSLFSKHATMAFGYGPWSEDYEETTGDKKAGLVEDLKQVARLVCDVEAYYDTKVLSVYTTVEHRTDFATYESVSIVLIRTKTFYELFGDKNFEYRHTENGIFLRRWEGKTLFTAVI